MTVPELGESLKRFRKTFKLSQEDMAKYMGVSRTMYQAYEGGKSAPSIIILANLADTYNVSLDDLTGRKNSNFTKLPAAPDEVPENSTIQDILLRLEMLEVSVAYIRPILDELEQQVAKLSTQ